MEIYKQITKFRIIYTNNFVNLLKIFQVKVKVLNLQKVCVCVYIIIYN